MNLVYLCKLGWRNIFRNQINTRLMGALVIFSTFIIVFFASFISGINSNFTTNLKNIVCGDFYIAARPRNGEAKNIFERSYAIFTFTPQLHTSLQNDQSIVAINPRIQIAVKAFTGSETIALNIFAFDLDQESAGKNNIICLAGSLPQANSREILIPFEIAEKYQISSGQTITIIGKTYARQWNSIDINVCGIYKSKSLSSWLDKYAIMPLADAKSFLQNEFAVSQINLQTINDDSQIKLFSQLQQNVLRDERIDLQLNSWREGSEYFAMLSAGLNIVFYTLTTIIMLMVLCGVVIVTMSAVVERRNEIETLLSLGFLKKHIIAIFFTEHLMLNIIMSVIGTALAVIIIGILKLTGIPIYNEALAGMLGAGFFYPVFSIDSIFLGILCAISASIIGTGAALVRFVNNK